MEATRKHPLVAAFLHQRTKYWEWRIVDGIVKTHIKTGQVRFDPIREAAASLIIVAKHDPKGGAGHPQEEHRGGRYQHRPPSNASQPQQQQNLQHHN